MKKGFTLIELLSVIVILSIILVIAVPQVLKVVTNSKKDSFRSSSMLVAKAVRQNVMLDVTKPTTINCLTDTGYRLNTTDYSSCTANISYGADETIVDVDLVGTGKFNGYTILGATPEKAVLIETSGTQSLSTVLLATVGTKDVDVNKYAGNGLYKWGTKYIYRGGLTKTNVAGLATAGYATDTTTGTEVNNYVKVPWETYTVGEDCTLSTNKCYRIISINTDGSITILRDKAESNQKFDNTYNTAAGAAYGYNDLFENIPTTGHPEEYRAYSAMYTKLYGSTGYQETVLDDYKYLLKPIDVCLNKVDSYAGLNNGSYSTTTYVKDTCDVTGKPNTTVVSPYQSKYVRLPYMEEYLNISLQTTCISGNQFQCRDQNYMYNITYFWSLNGYSSLSWLVCAVYAHGRAYSDYAHPSYGIRPVVNLKSTILITGGSGTQASPYVIKS